MLAGKTALVTGAAGAIGSAVAARLAAEGARLVLLDVAEAPLRNLARQWEGATAWPVDLRDAGAIAAAATAIGPVDILVNNAGILSNNKLDSTTLAEWQKVHAINVDAALLLTQAVLPGMRARRWGRIVNMSSFAAKSGGLTAGTAYSVSKAALIGLTFSVARETAGDGITVNAIAPAYVMSPMISEQLTEEQRQRQLAQIPVRRFCTPEEVAHTVAFLADPLAGFITGEVIDMNGGLQFD
jgi:3-oxoacyl-[acyl-carrier protein] reductase